MTGRPKPRSTLALAAMSALAVSGGWRHADAQVRFRTIAVAGEPVPDRPGVVYATLQFSVPVINERGDVLLVPNTTDPPTGTSPQAVVLAPATGMVRVLARVTEQAEHQPSGGLYARFFPPALDDDGDAQFIALALGGGLPAAGREMMYFVPAGGGAIGRLLAAEDPVPGIGGAVFLAMVGAAAPADLTDANRVVQVVSITGGTTTPADRAVLVRLTAGPVIAYEQIARRGTQASGFPAGVLYGTLGQFAAADDGSIAILSNLSGAGIDTTNDGCIWVFPADSSAPALLVREGQPAPGLSGPLIGASNYARLSRRGDVAGTLALTGTNVGPANDRYICVFPPVPPGGPVPMPRVVTRESQQPVPGYPPAAFVGTIDTNSQIQVNSRGEVAYVLSALNMVTAEDSGIISEARGIGTPQLVAREGLQAPGCPAGVVFDELLTNAAARFAINDSGHTAFFAPLRGTGVTSTNNFGLWLVDPQGEVHLVARKGDPMTIMVNGAPATRTIASVVLQGDAFPKSARRWLNNAGEMALAVVFNDTSSAVVVASLETPCTADFNGDGSSTLQDLFDFLTAWFALDAEADVNGVGGVTLQDVFDFLTAWFEGCP